MDKAAQGSAEALMKAQRDRELIEYARTQLDATARRHVRRGMGPASAARAAIRETQVLFPTDWRFGVQGNDNEEFVEVWEIEHKYPQPIATIFTGTH